MTSPTSPTSPTTEMPNHHDDSALAHAHKLAHDFADALVNALALADADANAHALARARSLAHDLVDALVRAAAPSVPHHLSPPMTDQHHATPEQWDLVASEAAVFWSATHACLLELRARVKKLEATQHARAAAAAAEARARARADALNDAGALTLADIITYGEANAHARDLVRHLSTDQLSATAAPAAADSLVERVAQGIAAADDEGLTNMTWDYHARAAIRAVAAVGYANPFNNVSEPGEHQGWLAAFTWLKQQASE